MFDHIAIQSRGVPCNTAPTKTGTDGFRIEVRIFRLEIARGIVSGEIKELYCIREGYFDFYNKLKTQYTLGKRNTFGKKYKVWCDQSGSYNPTDRTTTTEYHLRITYDYGMYYTIEKDTIISDYFETTFSIKKIRQEKLIKIIDENRSKNR